MKKFCYQMSLIGASASAATLILDVILDSPPKEMAKHLLDMLSSLVTAMLLKGMGLEDGSGTAAG